MLGNNILELRKKLGLSQEELSEKIGVTRQTISNWELNETQPNPEQLKLLSKVLNTSVDELIDNDIKSVLIEKTIRTEKNSSQVLKVVKIILTSIFVFFIFVCVMMGIFSINLSKDNKQFEESQVVTLNCSLNDKTYSYLVESDKDDNIIDHNGSEYISNILKGKEFKKGKMLVEFIIDYFKDNDGSC